MFIEIAPRQTGKTTRLLEAVVSVLKKGKKVVIVTFNLKMKKRYIKLLKIKYPTVKLDNLTISTKMVKKRINFVDEFDYLKEENLFIDKNAYYTSSLRTEMGSNFTRKLYSHYKPL